MRFRKRFYTPSTPPEAGEKSKIAGCKTMHYRVDFAKRGHPDSGREWTKKESELISSQYRKWYQANDVQLGSSRVVKHHIIYQ